MSVMLLNAGSSSLKATLMAAHDEQPVAQGAADWAGAETKYQYAVHDNQAHSDQVAWKGHAAAVRQFIHDLRHVKPIVLADVSVIAAVGHRIVHGGPFNSSVRISPHLRSRIAAQGDLAPLHNPPSLETLAAAESELPGAEHVAVFDTSFHSTLDPDAYTYPVPMKWTREWGIRRFGFHGLSYAYCSRRAAEMLGDTSSAARLVICHLGHGCSAAAVRSGQSVETTMGFTPLEGLMMGTRSGSLDPGIILHVQQHRELSAEQLEFVLNHESGLLGVSGVSGDMRRVLAAAKDGNDDARLAVSIYVHRVRQAIGALVATLGGVDALVVTAGVGENAADVRAKVCENLECFGLAIDPEKNGHCRPDTDIAKADSRSRIFVIATREDVTMYREVKNVLKQSA